MCDASMVNCVIEAAYIDGEEQAPSPVGAWIDEVEDRNAECRWGDEGGANIP